jgi:hypothetical protein
MRDGYAPERIAAASNARQRLIQAVAANIFRQLDERTFAKHAVPSQISRVFESREKAEDDARMARLRGWLHVEVCRFGGG